MHDTVAINFIMEIVKCLQDAKSSLEKINELDKTADAKYLHMINVDGWIATRNEKSELRSLQKSIDYYLNTVKLYRGKDLESFTDEPFKDFDVFGYYKSFGGDFLECFVQPHPLLTNELFKKIEERERLIQRLNELERE